jgi:hypothetical protein
MGLKPSEEVALELITRDGQVTMSKLVPIGSSLDKLAFY